MMTWCGTTSYFNPRSSGEERLRRRNNCFPSLIISIHAPRARSDPLQEPEYVRGIPFQSTLLGRGATLRFHPPIRSAAISIHAPRARSDGRCLQRMFPAPKFQSTLLGRGATAPSCLPAYLLQHFNPRSSGEERLRQSIGISRYKLISIHAPRARSDGFPD